MKKRLWLGLAIITSMVAMLFALSACASKTAPENLRYDGAYITWDKSETADYYNVSINSATPVRSNSNTYAYQSQDTFEATVSSVYGEKEKSTTITFKPLPSISELAVAENGELSWESVNGATAYALMVNGTEIVVNDTFYNQLAVGNNRVKVRPIVAGDNSFYSRWTEEKTVNIYATPKNVKYDGTTISWQGNALEYEVTVNGEKRIASGVSMAYDSAQKDFTVQIKALGNHSTTYDSAATTEEFKYLETISALFVEDGILKWNAVSGAEGYQLKINQIVQPKTVQVASYENLTVGASLDISVKPYNNSGNYFSSWSAERTIYILDVPTVSWNNDLELDGEENNNFIWNSVNAASGYTVRFTKNGNLVSENSFGQDIKSFKNAYSEVAVYTIEVKANAESDSATYFDSKYSAPITVERLAAPKAVADNFITSDRDNLAAGFTVNYVRVNGASGYQLYKDGVLLDGKFTTSAALRDNNVTDISKIEAQEINYTIRSMGSVKNVAGKKYVTLPCLSSEALSFKINVLATPQSLAMSGTRLSWNPVIGSNGYAVSYAGKSISAQSEELDLSTLKAGDYSVNLCARGNGGSTLASNYSSPLAIKRLSAPTNIRITSENEGTLHWNPVSYAKSYSTYLGLSKDSIGEEAYENMYQFIDTSGTTLSMIAVADYYNENHTVYYMSSEYSPTQQFIRLAAPTFSEGTISNMVELVWNAPSNINTAEYTPNYEVADREELLTGGLIKSTKYNIEYLLGGQKANYKVKAIGNSVKYLDSEWSEVKPVERLRSPEIKRENGEYVWQSVNNANSYYLEIDGKKVTDEFQVEGNNYAYTPRFTTKGKHKVTLLAVGDGVTTISSPKNSFEQIAEVLTTPTISFKYSSDTVVKDGKIIVNILNHDSHGQKYQYEISGESIVSAELSCSKTIQSNGKHTVKVKALGGTFDQNGIYYIDSQYAGGGASDCIVLLGTPSISSFNITSGGEIRWGSVSNCYGYEYQISYDGGSFGATEQVNFASMNVGANYKNYRSITIRVRARGSADQKTITSEWIEWTWTNSNK